MNPAYMTRQVHELGKGEVRFHAIFEDSPIAIWEEDFSLDKARLDKLRRSGVTDFRACLDQHPEEVSHLAALNMMEDAVLARNRTEEANVELRREIEERQRAEEALRQAKFFLQINKEYKIIRQSDQQELWVHGMSELEFDEQGTTITMIGTICWWKTSRASGEYSGKL